MDFQNWCDGRPGYNNIVMQFVMNLSFSLCSMHFGVLRIKVQRIAFNFKMDNYFAYTHFPNGHNKAYEM